MSVEFEMKEAIRRRVHELSDRESVGSSFIGFYSVDSDLVAKWLEVAGESSKDIYKLPERVRLNTRYEYHNGLWLPKILGGKRPSWEEGKIDIFLGDDFALDRLVFPSNGLARRVDPIYEEFAFLTRRGVGPGEYAILERILDSAEVTEPQPIKFYPPLFVGNSIGSTFPFGGPGTFR